MATYFCYKTMEGYVTKREYDELKEKYDDLCCLVAEEQVAKKKKKQQEEEKKCGELWVHSTAPEDCGWPKILSLCSPKEREMLFQKARQNIVDGKWKGGRHGNNFNARPGILFEAQLIREREERGELPRREYQRKNRPGKTRQARKQTYYLTHILLIANGNYPKQWDVASHLCHNTQCCDVAHMTWESQTTNIKREICRRKRSCECGEQKKCVFDCK